MPHLPGNVTVPLDLGSVVGRVLADGKPFTLSTRYRNQSQNIPEQENLPNAMAIERFSELHCYARVFPLGLF